MCIRDRYWDDGTKVNAEADENLFLTLNAVLQRPKYTESYPLEDSYFIDKTVIPNVIKFDVAPIWDQDLGAKTIGEPTAVEKVAGIGVGNYKRLTIDYNLVDGVKNGPFLILDVEDYTVQSIEAEDALYVFLDGVLQRKDYSYTVSGPNIFFNVPIKKEMKIDMRYLYGRDVGQVINFYDFSPDTYFSTGTLTFDSTDSIWDTFSKYTWMGDKIGAPIHAWQVKPDGTFNVIGKVRNYTNTGTQVIFDVPQAQNSTILSGVDVIFGVASYYDTNITVPASAFTNPTLTLVKDEDGRKLLKADIQAWSGTVIGKTYRNPFGVLSGGDQIRVDGEDGFRKIKNLPGVTTSKDNRDGEQLSDDIFAPVSVESYTGITRGEGLSVIATIENGSVTKLTWNQRSYDPITQPTAYQYFTPPILKFEPLNGDGGGARANVLVSKGQVISVDLIDGGSGYTKAPKVIVTRRFDVLSDRGIGVSKINIAYRPYIDVSQSSLVISTIDILGNRLVDAFSYSSVDLVSPADVDRKIEAEIQTGDTGLPTSNLVDGGFDMPPGGEQPGGAQVVYIEPEPVQIEGIGGALRLQGSETVVKAEIQDVITTTSITNVSKVITATQQIEIPNNALSNINYFEDAAYLDLDFNIGDSIAYIPDTSKFYGTGLLLIGDEVVRYNRKLDDRFLYITRGRRGTTEKDWVAGTFLRQIPELVSVAPVGIAKVESESQLVAVSAGADGTGRTEQKNQYQFEIDQFETLVTREIELDLQPQLDVDSISTIITQVTRIPPTSVPTIATAFVTSHNQTVVTNRVQTVHSEFVMQKNQLEVLLITPPGGVIDGFEETVFITDPINIRSGNTTGGHDGEVDIVDVGGRYYVVKRDTTEIFIDNAIFGVADEYIGKYTKTNAGHRISHFDGIFDDGTSRVSGLSLAELDLYFGALTIRDFTERANSSYTIAGDKFNLLNPSIQNPVQINTTPVTFSGPEQSIVVSDTTGFPDEGYLYHSNGGGTQTPVGNLQQRQYAVGGTVDLEISSNQKFGDRSVYLSRLAGNNDGNYLAAYNLELGAGDFSVEYWFDKRTLAFPASPGALTFYGSNLLTGASWGGGSYFRPNFGFSMFVDVFYSSTSSLKFWNGETGTFDTISGFISENTWYHVSIVRKNGTIKVYLNGVEKASRSNSQDYTTTGAAAAGNAWGTGGTAFFDIGSHNIATGYDTFHGYIDDVSVSTVARRDGNFNVPTAPATVDSNTILYDNFDTIIPSYTGVIKYTGRSPSTFTGCTLHNGDNQIVSGSEIVPFTI